MFSINLLRICFLGLQITFSAGYTLYNGENNICCNGNIFPLIRSEGEYQDCCGDKTMVVQFDNDASPCSRCCNGEIITRDSCDYNLVCCNKALIDISKEVCVNNADHQEITESDRKAKKTQICSTSSNKIEFYNNREFECCEGQLYPKELQKECLGPDYVSNKDTTFCYDLDQKKAHLLKNKNKHKMLCCGLEIYNSDEQSCVMNKVVKINEEITKHCCGFTYTYNWTYYGMWDLKEYKNEGDDEDCGQFYAFNEEYACTKNVLHQPCKNETVCNWNSKKYNYGTQACCFSQIVDLTEEDKKDGNFQCCEEGAPNSVFDQSMLF